MLQLEHILACIGEYFGFTVQELKNSNSNKDLSYARQLYSYFAMGIPDMTLKRAATFIGKKNHSIVHDGKKHVYNWIKIDPSVQKDVNAIRILLEQPVYYNLVQQVLKNTPPHKMGELHNLLTNWQKNLKE